MLRLRRDLSFSHLLELSRVSDPVARAFYEVQTLAHRWSVRELKRQRDSMLYERVGLSRDREAVLALANEGRLLDTATTNVRDPYVLEFLGLPERRVYSESDLESALVDHLQEFLLELGGDEEQLRTWLAEERELLARGAKTKEGEPEQRLAWHPRKADE